MVLVVAMTLWLRRLGQGPMEIVTHGAHRWLVRNTMGRLQAGRGGTRSSMPGPTAGS